MEILTTPRLKVFLDGVRVSGGAVVENVDLPHPAATNTPSLVGDPAVDEQDNDDEYKLSLTVPGAQGIITYVALNPEAPTIATLVHSSILKKLTITGTGFTDQSLADPTVVLIAYPGDSSSREIDAGCTVVLNDSTIEVIKFVPRGTGNHTVKVRAQSITSSPAYIAL